MAELGKPVELAVSPAATVKLGQGLALVPGAEHAVVSFVPTGGKAHTLSSLAIPAGATTTAAATKPAAKGRTR